MTSEYDIKKEGAWWLVVSRHTGIVQHRSLKRINCVDWIAAQVPLEEEA